MKKSIVIVTPESDRSTGLRLSEALISKYKLHAAPVWSINLFKDNEPKLTGKEAFIFIGGPGANPLVEEYLASGMLRETTNCNTFTLYKSTNKYFICGKLGAVTTLSAANHFLDFFADDFVNSIMTEN